MSDDTQPPAFPIAVELSDGTYHLLDSEGDPSGVRVQCPCGSVTSLHTHGGTLDHLSEEDMSALLGAEPIDV